MKLIFRFLLYEYKKFLNSLEFPVIFLKEEVREKTTAVRQLIRYNKVYYPFNSIPLTLVYFCLCLYSSALKAKTCMILIRILHIVVHILGIKYPNKTTPTAQ